jgi:hypothetical protein
MKKTRLITTVIALLVAGALPAQGKYFTKTGKISFFSSTPMENITANHKSAVCLLNSATGDIEFALLVKGFEFKKAKMQEDFNQDYVESSKFPKSEFKGQITNNSTVNYPVNGSYPVTVKGKLTLHGVTKDIETSGTVVVKDGKLQVNAAFNVLVADYNIKIPKVYGDLIAKSIKVTVDCALALLP